jgi:hypothetical protein
MAMLGLFYLTREISSGCREVSEGSFDRVYWFERKIERYGP